MTIDQKLNFKEHFKNIRVTTTKNINIIKYLAGKKWGCNQQQLINIGNAFIRSKMEYGAPITISASKQAINYINPIYNNLLRTATGAFIATPIKSLHALTKTLPIVSRFNQILLKYYFKILTNPRHP